MSEKIRWGIMGAGAIAKALTLGVQQSETGEMKAIASRTKDKADAFAREHDIPTAYGSYEELAGADDVDVIYIATPHPMHPKDAVLAMRHGKAVLCEKPSYINQWGTDRMIGEAKKQGVFWMEAFMYRCHPQTRKLVEVVSSGRIGEVKYIYATFGFNAGFNPEGRLFSQQLGGGGILDVGCYPVSFARLIAGAAEGKPFADPVQVTGAGTLLETGVDGWAGGVLKFESGIIANVATACNAAIGSSARIVGTNGSIEVPDPWTAGRTDGGTYTIKVMENGKDPEAITLESDVTAYAYEADVVGRALQAKRQQPEPPAMTWDDSMGNIKALDEWRAHVGVVYDMEKPRPVSENILGEKIETRVDASDHNMQYANIPGLDKPVSKFIFGALTSNGSFPKAQVMFDHWLEVGGNTFDTGHVYGPCDRIMGQWLNSRGIRDDLVVIAKGAHHPHDTPEGLTKPLTESLDWMQTDYCDIFIMHRDNPDVPVGEFIDLLNEHKDAGRITVFGGSNWSIDRFVEANEYAEKNGKQGMTILNNNLSLALMVDPVWLNCIHVSDPESLKRLEAMQAVHFAWSSQARGFFTDRATPGQITDPELQRCWVSDENYKRRERAYELAEQKGCLPINISAAYVLCQPFPSFALIGPENTYEMDTCLPGLDVQLTPQELAYLSLQADSPQ